ncbi:MAG: tetratricopeptide repeat protein [Bacteroidales bacterium]|uniref:tetratricopeptide repeat protein n=1 Tax=Porphyromonas sp. TaxID=1924944 RepID=UPI002974F6DF|nr:tetratricopeptide repeat protein [Porphyromonas sp.]MDD7437778.1 tetratricopeptide repeat protein [Bacteroidales bacterium]MDY3067285.1 tetratricopeptide repeat protein [Porphyromonas sp.]
MRNFVLSILLLICSQFGLQAQQTISQEYQALVQRYYDYYEAEQPDSAELVLRETLERFPNEPINYVLRGNLAELLLARQDTTSALAELSDAIREQPQVTQLRSRRAEVYEERGMYNEALIDLDELIRQQPTWEIPLYNRARVRSLLGLYEGAIADLELIMTINPEAYLPRVALAEAYEKAGRALDAEKLLSKLIEGFPKIPNAYRAMGWLLLRLDRKSEALEKVRYPINELKDTNKENYLLRGTIWLSYGELKESDKDYAEALRLGATKEEIDRAKNYGKNR